MNIKIADLHCHSTLIPYNEMRKTVWYTHRKLLLHRRLASQGDFKKLAKGGTRVLFLALYPIEQGYLNCKLFDIGTGDRADRMAHYTLKMPKARADEIQDYDHSYFKDLLGEYDFLINSPDTKKVRLNLLSRKKEFKFKIVRNFDDLKNILNLDDNFKYRSATDDTIAVIPTIEGAHSLGTGQKNTLTLNYSELHNSIIDNIVKLKKLGPSGLYCPFFITLCHFFWNQLGGHAVSLWDRPGTIRIWDRPGKLFDQNFGINKDIELLGKSVVDALLSKANGKRILIDVAHMSVNVRRWYYYKYLPKRKLETGETIPVILSHTGVNGWKDFSQSEVLGHSDIVHEYSDERYENSTIFNPWDVFLSDEEILLIHDSGGLMGLALDQRIMMGRKTLETMRKKATFKSPYRKREIWIEPLIEEIIHIAKTIYNIDRNTIWDNICIGSDYDGMIKPINAYPNATHFPYLDKMLYEGLKKRSSSETAELFLKGATDNAIREITDKIVWKNALQFLKKHFV